MRTVGDNNLCTLEVATLNVVLAHNHKSGKLTVRSCVELKVTLTNCGNFEQNEKIQVYAEIKDSRTTAPNFQLCGVKAVTLNPFETKETEIEIDKYWLKVVLENGERVEADGTITLFIGNHQPDSRSNKLCDDKCLELKLK